MKPKVQSESNAPEDRAGLQPPIIMAPLRGVTDVIYRSTYADHFEGVDQAVAPFITTHAGRRIKPAHVRDLRPEDNRKLPTVPQILTKSAKDFVQLAHHLFDMGYTTINLNCGCPFPQVANKGRGSGLLCRPDELDRLLDTVLAQIPNRLSVKTRLGRRQADEIQAVMRIYNRYPLESVIVHPRTGIQMYAGQPDLAVFAWCLDRCRHPVVYNGDIRDEVGFEALTQRFGKAAGWMIGRGLLADPFLPGRLKAGRPLDAAHKTKRFRRFHDDLFARYQERLSGPGHLLDRMKGLWKYFAPGFHNSDAARKRILKSRTIRQYRDSVNAFWEAGPQWV